MNTLLYGILITRLTVYEESGHMYKVLYLYYLIKNVHFDYFEYLYAHIFGNIKIKPNSNSSIDIILCQPILYSYLYATDNK